MYYPERLKFPGKKNTPQNTFFREQLPVASVKFQLVFYKGKKQKQFFIPSLCSIHLKSCNCIKIVKFAFIHNFEKHDSNLSLVSFKFCNIKYRSSHQRCSIKKGVLRNFTIFTGKHLCQGLFFKNLFNRTPLDNCFSKYENHSACFSRNAYIFF